MSNYADLIERLVEGKSSYIDPLARDLWNRDGFAARDAISRLERERAAILKVRDGYASQMKFCDIEALGYFREFVRRIDEALSRTQEQTA